MVLVVRWRFATYLRGSEDRFLKQVRTKRLNKRIFKVDLYVSSVLLLESAVVFCGRRDVNVKAFRRRYAHAFYNYW